MKLIVVLCLVAVACAQQRRDEARILTYENENNGLGYFRWSYQLSDGQRHNQEGELKNAGRDNEALSVKGQYSWVSPEGIQYIVTYVADENGFQPEVEEGPGVNPSLLASALG